MTPAETVEYCKNHGIGIIDLKFTDLPGTLQHLSIPLSELTEENLSDGYGFDGSSIRGFKSIEERKGPRFPAAGRGFHRRLDRDLDRL